MNKKFLYSFLCANLSFISCKTNNTFSKKDGGTREIRPISSLKPVEEDEIAPSAYEKITHSIKPSLALSKNKYSSSSYSSNCNSQFDVGRAQRKVVELTNRFRAQNKLPPLLFDRVLEDLAAEWSKTMARTDRFQHRRNILLPGFYAAAENIAQYSFFREQKPDIVAKQLVDQWIESPGHRANMLGRYTALGAGIYCIRDEVYGTQNFGSK